MHPKHNGAPGASPGDAGFMPWVLVLSDRCGTPSP